MYLDVLLCCFSSAYSHLLSPTYLLSLFGIFNALSEEDVEKSDFIWRCQKAAQVPLRAEAVTEKHTLGILPLAAVPVTQHNCLPH